MNVYVDHCVSRVWCGILTGPKVGFSSMVIMSTAWCETAAAALLTNRRYYSVTRSHWYIEGILPKGPHLPCLRMAVRALLLNKIQLLLYAWDISLDYWHGSNTLTKFSPLVAYRKWYQQIPLQPVTKFPYNDDIWWNIYHCLYWKLLNDNFGNCQWQRFH